MSPPADDGSAPEDSSQPENDGEGTFWENLSAYKHNDTRRKCHHKRIHLILQGLNLRKQRLEKTLRRI